MGKRVPREALKEVWIVGDPLCKPCEKIAEYLQDEIKSGKVKLKNLNDPGILKILTEERVDVPFGVIKEGEKKRACQIFADDKTVLLKCDEEIVPLKEEKP